MTFTLRSDLGCRNVYTKFVTRCTFKNFSDSFQASHAHLTDVDRAILGASVSG
jgi:hypothetical protein